MHYRGKSSKGSKPLAIDLRPVRAGHRRGVVDKSVGHAVNGPGSRRGAVDDGCWMPGVGAGLRLGLRLRSGQDWDEDQDYDAADLH
jgi:hypothetical protein